MYSFSGKSVVECRTPLMHVFSDAIFNKDGMRETEKTIIREQLLERWMSQKQLEVEVIKDMKLQWSKNSMPSDNLEAGNESIDKPPNGIYILSN